MGTRRGTWVWLLVALALALGVAAGCARPTDTLSDRERTLASIEQVDDYPLYVMHSYGDYGFDDLLEAREQRLAGASRAPFTSGACPAWACTCFAAASPDGEPLFGRSFDWQQEPVTLVFTDPPAGYASVSLVHGQALVENPLEAPLWPYDGMNVRGLVVGMMAVPHAEGGTDPGRVTLGTLEVIRLLLDHAANVDEALRLLEDYNVSFAGGPPVHYMLADRSGNSAVVEYLNGETVVLRREGPFQVSTNFLLHEEPRQGLDAPCKRYKAAYGALSEADGVVDVEGALGILRDVSQKSTVWSVVYSQHSGAVRLVMGRQWDSAHAWTLAME